MLGFILQILAMVGITLVLMRYFTRFDPIKSIRWDINLNGFKRLIGIKPKSHKDMTMGDVMGGMAPPDVKDQSVYEIPPEDSNYRGLSSMKVTMDDGTATDAVTWGATHASKYGGDEEPKLLKDIDKDTLDKLDDFLNDN